MSNERLTLPFPIPPHADLVCTIDDTHHGMWHIRIRVQFPNGYGASIIRGTGCYSDLSAGKPWEVAVLYDDDITYQTPITDDVLGYQSDADVGRVLARIAALEGSPEC